MTAGGTDFGNALLALFADTVKVASVTTVDGYNEPTFGPDVEHAAHVRNKRKSVTEADGRTTVLGGKVYFSQVVAVDTQSRITMPNGDTPPIYYVETLHDENGPSHTVLTFASGV
jgi:hypothetical protein